MSYPVSQKTPLYGNATGIEIKPDQHQSKGDGCNTMVWNFSNHTGTHVDVPRHFSLSGRTVTDYPPEFWIFNRIEVVDISNSVHDCQIIEPGIIPDFYTSEPELVLFQTGYGKFRGTDRYTLTPPGFSENVYCWLKNKYPSVRCIGMDIISISSFCNRDEGRKAHKAFLAPEQGAPVLLIEDMRLNFKGGLKQVIVAPVIVEHADGSPCTVFGIVSD
ncbi:predicted cyclase [Desulfobacula toluolica Tol2]|uniref:Predicted cyclase n=1 Tax=Desulfobacula toluolica (strain DSM 7467 / Tol2) TaxID=651182 RepID=K0N8R3_DESTT|nr:predicted cyclase [Desulfobacula toluolica Tol2]